ncbi:NB-ARC domain-containing protein [Nonomuraea rubra]|uniref:NB-ARC domain-containing protein n=1 Tax=Nonomuraea rubra TaxID=46180 RepID=UPI0033F1960A
MPPRNPEWVDRQELARVAAALQRRSAPVGLTTGIIGARRLVTIGRDRGDAEVASLINHVVAHLDGKRPQTSDPEQAGHRLAGFLSGRGRVLLVIDDVWNADQLAPFLLGAAEAQLLVTTRRSSVVPGTMIPAGGRPVAHPRPSLHAG